MNVEQERVEISYSFYSVMVHEQRGWRLLVPPAPTPEEACETLADLIRREEPAGQQSDEVHQHIEQALRLAQQDDYEMIIGGRRHRLVRANLTVPFGPGGPCGPGPHDQIFAEFPWNLAASPEPYD